VTTTTAPRINGHPQTHGHLPAAGPVAPTVILRAPAVTPAGNDAPTPTTSNPSGVGLFYVAATAATGVSVDTSWRFFGEVLGITRDWERGGMFAVLEITMLACGYAMRANVRRPGGTPGPARILAWALCGLSAFMAVVLSGPLPGIARVVLGPILAIVCLHMALGIEIRVASGGRVSGTWAKIGRELRERSLSILGLGNDKRDAATRISDRALHRAARLATTRRTPRRTQRLAKAVRMSGAATDPKRRQQLVSETAALRHVGDLATVEWRSPWRDDTDVMSDTDADMNVDTDADNVGHETSVSAAQTPRVTDTESDIMSDTNGPDMTPAARRHVGQNLRHSPSAARTQIRSSRGQDTRARVGRLAAKTPDITPAAVAAARHSERTRSATDHPRRHGSLVVHPLRHARGDPGRAVRVMTANPLAALDQLGVAEVWARGGHDMPEWVVSAMQDAHGALDDLIDASARIADPHSRLAVIDAVWNCGDKRGDAKWWGNRAYYSADDGGIVDITAIIRHHPHLFDRDGHGCVTATIAGLGLLDRRDYDQRHPMRAIVAETFGRRDAGGVKCGKTSTYHRWSMAIGLVATVAVIVAFAAGHEFVGIGIAIGTFGVLSAADKIYDRRHRRANPIAGRKPGRGPSGPQCADEEE
jgi:hypothetical protein